MLGRARLFSRRRLVRLILPLLALAALPWKACPTSGQLLPASTLSLAPAQRGPPSAPPPPPPAHSAPPSTGSSPPTSPQPGPKPPALSPSHRPKTENRGTGLLSPRVNMSAPEIFQEIFGGAMRGPLSHGFWQVEEGGEGGWSGRRGIVVALVEGRGGRLMRGSGCTRG